MYLYVDTFEPFDTQNALMLSPPMWTDSNQNFCLDLWYWKNDESGCKFSVKLFE